MQGNTRQKQRLGLIPKPIIQHHFIIMDISQLTRNRHPLLILGTCLPIKQQTLTCGPPRAIVQEVGANHDPGSAFSGLTMDDGNVLRVTGYPVVYVGAEGLHEFDGGRVMVFKWVMRDYTPS